MPSDKLYKFIGYIPESAVEKSKLPYLMQAQGKLAIIVIVAGRCLGLGNSNHSKGQILPSARLIRLSMCLSGE